MVQRKSTELQRSKSDESPSLGELLLRLKDDAIGVVESEIDLLKTEARARGDAAKQGLGPAMLAFAAAVVGLMSLTAAAVIGLGVVLGDRYWLSALILGVILLCVAYAGYSHAHRQFQRALQTDKKDDVR